jgi:hypothetical protein
MLCAPCLVLSTDTDAVTTVNGTEVCREHVISLARGLPMQEVRRAAVAQLRESALVSEAKTPGSRAATPATPASPGQKH